MRKSNGPNTVTAKKEDELASFIWNFIIKCSTKLPNNFRFCKGLPYSTTSLTSIYSEDHVCCHAH